LFKISKRGLEWSSETLGFLPKVEDLIEKFPCESKLFYNAFTGQAVNPVSAEAPNGLLEE
jgi:hypothetical protein